MDYLHIALIVISSLSTLAAVAPTHSDHHVLGRIKNLMNKVLQVRHLFKKK